MSGPIDPETKTIVINPTKPEPKPGWKTTQFWLTAFGAALSLSVVTGIVPSSDAAQLSSHIAEAVKHLGAAFISVTLIVSYIIHRHKTYKDAK